MTDGQPERPRIEERGARREAFPLHADDVWRFTSTQDDARRRIRELLRIEANVRWSPSAPRQGVDLFLPRIDRTRSARVFLIDGPRGSGKSTLLVTLLDELAGQVRTALGRQEPTERVENEPQAMVVPAALLDFSPLAASTNLVLHVGAAIFRIVDAMAGGDPAARSLDGPPWLGTRPGAPESLTRWNEFVQVAAAGWDGNLLQRGPRLDPEIYATELEEAERMRLDLQSRFAAFVDAVVQDLRRWLGIARWPLLLVAIDDADMDPARSPELLQLLRSLYHPRLVFLLTGDSELFERTLELQVRRAMVPPEQNETRQLEQVRFARNLASDMYVKLIPDRQRFRVGAMTPVERAERLVAWLQRLRTQAPHERLPSELDALSRYLENVPELGAALPAKVRSETDVRQMLAEMLGETPSHPVFFRVLAHLWRFAVESSGADEDNPALSSTVSVDDRGTLTVSDEQDLLRLSAVRQLSLEGEGGMRVIAARPDRWVIDTGTARRTNGLDRDLAATLLLCSIFAIEHREGRYLRAHRRYEEAGASFVWGQIRIADTLTEFGWPMFSDQLVTDRALVATCWTRILSNMEAEGTAVGIDLLARQYLAGVLHVLRYRTVPTHPMVGPWKAIVTELVGLLGHTRLAPQPERRRELVRTWIEAQAGLLAAPESGLPAASAGMLLAELRTAFKDDVWQEMRRRLQVARRQRAQRVVPATAVDPRASTDTAVLHEIDARFPEHPWLTVVGAATTGGTPTDPADARSDA